MNKIHIVLLSALLVVLASCFLRVGDNAIRIRGELVVDEPSNENCLLELRLHSKETLLRALPISGAFESTFTVSPWPQAYYVVIYCSGTGEVFRSDKFHVKDTTYFSTPLDLGRIRVKANKQTTKMKRLVSKLVV